MDLRGQKLGQYQILEEIGRGGMAVVYRAWQENLGRHVAIKILPSQFTFDEEFVRRFLREARTAAKLNHPNIITIYDVGQQENLYYIAMQYVEGVTLKELIAERGALPPSQVVSIVQQIADALDYAHQRGFIHRDIKPTNIMLDAQGHAILMDFGIARAVVGTSLTRTGTIVGTPEYIAPEQIELGRAVDHRCDLYSLGIVCYEMLTGRVPFQGDTLQVLYAQIHAPPPPLRDLNPDLPSALEKVLRKALEKDPQKRFQSAGEMAQALEEAVKKATGKKAPSPRPLTPASAPASSVARPIPHRKTRFPAVSLLGLGALLVVLLVGGALLFLGGNQGGEATPTAITTPPTPVIIVVSTPTSTATPKPTSTLTPTHTATPTAIPTATATSTRTPFPTPTSTPSPTNTPLPAPTPRLYSAPSPYAPSDGFRQRSLRITLEWTWVGTLKSDEGFDVQVWREGEQPHSAGIATAENRKEDRWALPLDMPSPGTYYWRVQVVRKQPDGTWGTPASEVSETWRFVIETGGGPPTGPKPTPTFTLPPS